MVVSKAAYPATNGIVATIQAAKDIKTIDEILRMQGSVVNKAEAKERVFEQGVRCLHTEKGSLLNSPISIVNVSGLTALQRLHKLATLSVLLR